MIFPIPFESKIYAQGWHYLQLTPTQIIQHLASVGVPLNPAFEAKVRY